MELSRIQLRWIPSRQMISDGLTKLMPVGSADISYMFSTYVGAGGFVRLAVGSVDLQRGGTSVTTSVGGFQSGGGLRVRF